MANIKSQKKRVLQDRKRRLKNMSVRSKMKTVTKQAVAALESKDAEQVKVALPAALAAIDRAAAKGVLHRNAAARKKSSLQRIANSAV